MKTTVNITPKGIAIETDDMVINIESNSEVKFQRAIERSQQVADLVKGIVDVTQKNGAQQYSLKKTAKPLKKELGHILIKNTVKKCAKCGNEFKPSGSQKYCSIACGLKPKPEKERIVSKLRKTKSLTPEEEAELEKTLAEINQRQHQPYQIS